jgi:hypothetical protein
MQTELQLTAGIRSQKLVTAWAMARPLLENITVVAVVETVEETDMYS